MKGLYIRSRLTINPDKVYRMAMRRLNTSAGILEVMGAPLSGTELRAYVMSGGGLTLKNFKPSLRTKRCFLIFPIRGSERKGLVSVEVKNKKGQVCFYSSHFSCIPHIRWGNETFCMWLYKSLYCSTSASFVTLNETVSWSSIFMCTFFLLHVVKICRLQEWFHVMLLELGFLGQLEVH